MRDVLRESFGPKSAKSTNDGLSFRQIPEKNTGANARDDGAAPVCLLARSDGRREVLIDAADFELVRERRWCVSTNGRGYSYVVSGGLSLHRLIMGVNGPSDNHRLVDHINGNGLDNRRANLRVCNTAQNTRNQKLSKNSTTGLKGVCRQPNGKYRSKITVANYQINLGTFATAEAAHEAYRAAAHNFHGEFARFA